jgi:sensor histidine kinase regulating citrate/malate metabolism
MTVPSQNPRMPDSALCVLFANLLENAVEACGRMDGGARFIRLHSALEYGVLTIAMDNSFDGKAAVRDGIFFSSKRVDAPGIGLNSIRAVARAYQGDARFAAEGTLFQSSVYVKL